MEQGEEGEEEEEEKDEDEEIAEVVRLSEMHREILVSPSVGQSGCAADAAVPVLSDQPVRSASYIMPGSQSQCWSASMYVQEPCTYFHPYSHIYT